MLNDVDPAQVRLVPRVNSRFVLLVHREAQALCQVTNSRWQVGARAETQMWKAGGIKDGGESNLKPKRRIDVLDDGRDRQDKVR